MKRLNWAILGTGTIANDFARQLEKTGEGIYAAASRNLEKAETFAEKYTIQKIYGSYEEALCDKEVDVVYIATPHSNHYEYIVQCLNAKKHVLCEKAITVNGTQLKDAKRIANQNGVVLAEAMTIYHMPLIKKLKQMIEDGKIGTLKMIQVNFGSLKEYDVTNRFFNPDLAGGALLDIGTYALSFARYFLSSQPDEVLTTVKRFETGVDEQSGIILKNKEEELAVISLTMRAKQPKRGIICGDRGYMSVENYPRADRALLVYPDGKTEEITAGDTEDALAYEIEGMKKLILEGATNSSLELSENVMDLMDEIRSSWGLKYTFE